jgi:predicted PurR-regulated permease PerM
VYVVLIGALVGLGLALIPKLASEATSLVTKLPNMVMNGSLAKLPIPAWAAPVREQIVDALRKQASGLEAQVVPFIQKAGSQIVSGVGTLVPIILIPILAFFFLKDASSLKAATLQAVHGRKRETLETILDDVHGVLQNYLKAMVILAAASFTAWMIFLNVLGEPYALLLAGTAGVLEFIPVVGPAAALVAILLVSGISGSGGLVWILVFWGLYRIFQDYVLNPFLMSSGVEVHPLLVLFGVLAGDKLGGVAGMFFSVPAIAILRVVVNNLSKEASERDLRLAD